jgi:hypothetical protein
MQCRESVDFAEIFKQSVLIKKAQQSNCAAEYPLAGGAGYVGYISISQS